MKTYILCISDGDKHFSSAIKEYIKRLGPSCTIQYIKPVKHGSKKQIINKETKKIQEALNSKVYIESKIVLLDKGGKQMTTQEFTTLVGSGTHGISVVFVLGGPYGLDIPLLRKNTYGVSSPKQLVSLGKHTMPHSLAKLVLLEQIYRVSMIEQHKLYHY